MKTRQTQWTASEGWSTVPRELDIAPQWVLVFGSRDVLEQDSALADLRGAFPDAAIVGCSTAGEICDVQVLDDSVVATAVEFESGWLEVSEVDLEEVEDSLAAGKALVDRLDLNDLVHVLVLSDGVKVNGSALVQGLVGALPPEVRVTGGLSGDGTAFERTVTVSEGRARSNRVVALGLYGDGITVGHGCLGGWDPFGPERVVTRSEGNVLYALDGKPALELYRRYLGPYADDLPSSALLFPLSLREAEGEGSVVRTILGVDAEAGSMTFAGDVPEGSYVRLMKANFDRLIDGAVGAAESSRENLGSSSADLAILISCVGRKIVLDQRTEEEAEGVREVLGPGPSMTGFYSYGEVSPLKPDAGCELHNQTMTITTVSER